MDLLHEPTDEAVSELQRMLDTPIEDQAASYELNFLGSILANGIELLNDARSEEEICEIMRQMIKSAFVVGRRHSRQLI